MKKDYEILGITEDTEINQIGKAYLKAIKNCNSNDINKIKQINEAYKNINKEIVKNKDKLPSGEQLTEKDLEDAIKQTFIENTNIPKPRDRDVHETDKEYEVYLEKYSEKYFPTKLRETKNNVINDTDILRPRDRAPHETDEHYNKFLKEFYDKRFPHNTIETKEELIENTSIKKPRDRMDYEVDKNYENFLENYYSKVFNKKTETHRIINKKKCKNHKFLRKMMTGAILTLAGLGIFPAYTKDKQGKVQDNNAKQEFSKDDYKDQELEQMLNEETRKVLNQKHNATIGDVIKLKEGTKYYNDSQKAKPVGKIGNIYSDANSYYLVDAISIVDKETNDIVAVSYDGGISTKDLIEKNNVDSKNIKKMYHISINNNKLEESSLDRGWVQFDKTNYKFKKNVSHLKGKGK